MRPPAIISVTAAIIISIPHSIRGVNASPNTVTPIMTAVTGSNAPRIAVGVEPMYCIALVVHKKEIAVGKTANANRLPHKYHWSASGTDRFFPQNSRRTNKNTPNNRT